MGITNCETKNDFLPVFTLVHFCWSVSVLKINNKRHLCYHTANHSVFINDKSKVAERTWDHTILISLKQGTRGCLDTALMIKFPHLPLTSHEEISVRR